LLLDSAKPGTTIAVASESGLTLATHSIKSQVSSNNMAYEYEFYNPSNINMEKREAGSYVLTVK